ESAAMISKFAPVFVAGRAVRVSGVVNYRYGLSAKPQISLKKMKAEPLSDEDLRAIKRGQKLHFWLYPLVARLEKKDSSPGPNEAAFVREGKAAIRIELVDASPYAIEKLKALGFELDSQKDKTVTGKIEVEKLAALADLDAVKLVLPKL